jgi:ATP-dependent DNA helicase RecQ
LLRAYEGIFDFPSAISEIVLAQLIKKDKADVKKDLEILHSFGIIEYQPQKDTPQIFLIQPRIKTEDLYIDMAAYLKRKENFRTRTTQIISYVNEKLQCRSQLIGFYFGDSQMKKCNVCDNCLHQKGIVISKEEVEKISGIIKVVLTLQPLPSKELIENLGHIKKEKAWKVIDLLQAENEIEMDKAGWVRLK